MSEADHADPGARLDHALELSFRYLARRDRTVREVRQRLEAQEIEPAIAEQAIASLLEQHYLDDERYARLFAEDRRSLDGWGIERIEAKLIAVGVARETIAAVLGERNGADELQAALELLERRVAAPPRDERERDRALGLLVRRGYELEVAYDAVRAFERS